MTISATICKADLSYGITIHRDGEFLLSRVYPYIPLRVAKEFAAQKVRQLTDAELSDWAVTESGRWEAHTA